MRRTYLDHNAGSPLRPVARRVLAELSRRRLGNPSSAHSEGRQARALLEDARARLAALLDAPRDGVVFTSGGTESNALALTACPPARALAAGATEHPSVLAPARARERFLLLPVDPDGHVRLSAAALERDGIGLLSVALANHETGVVQDVRALAALARRAGALVHTDASQAFGRVPVSFARLGVDLLTVSSHKLGGPVGIGALVARAGAALSPLLLGGGQEGGLRAGTEAAVLARAFVAAAEDACLTLSSTAARWRAQHRWLRSHVTRLGHETVFHSPIEGGLPNTLNVSFPGVRGTSIVPRLDLEGIAVSHGSACSSGSLEASPVLRAMGVDDELARSSVRISFGPRTTHDDVRHLVACLAEVLPDLASRAR